MSKIEVVLASSSPRRRQLLDEAGIRFRVQAADADESLDDDLRADPARAARTVAERKAAMVVQQVIADSLTHTTAVIGADTMVVLDGRIFGKPQNFSAACGMLRKLSGRTHQVITGVSVWMLEPTANGEVSIGRRTFSEVSEVTFKDLSDDDIKTYVHTGEAYDKAGSYAIQGEGARLVAHWEGDWRNIVGLPVETLLYLVPALCESDT